MNEQRWPVQPPFRFKFACFALTPQHGVVAILSDAYLDAYFFPERTLLVGLCFIAGGGQQLWMQALRDVTFVHPPRHNLRAMATAN
jgi:hypothetical protein